MHGYISINIKGDSVIIQSVEDENVREQEKYRFQKYLIGSVFARIILIFVGMMIPLYLLGVTLYSLSTDIVDKENWTGEEGSEAPARPVHSVFGGILTVSIRF